MIDLTLVTIFSVFLVLLLLVFIWRRIFLLQKELKTESKEKKEAVDLSFEKLMKRIEKEVEFLDGQAGLSQEEKKLRDKLFEAVESSRELIKKVIEDVEKKVK